MNALFLTYHCDDVMFIFTQHSMQWKVYVFTFLIHAYAETYIHSTYIQTQFGTAEGILMKYERVNNGESRLRSRSGFVRCPPPVGLLILVAPGSLLEHVTQPGFGVDLYTTPEERVNVMLAVVFQHKMRIYRALLKRV